jgi:excisionase family DNA binding protein
MTDNSEVDELKPLLTVRDVALLLGCHPVTVRLIVARGELDVIRLGSSGRPSLRFHPDAVRRYIEERSL